MMINIHQIYGFQLSTTGMSKKFVMLVFNLGMHQSWERSELFKKILIHFYRKLNCRWRRPIKIRLLLVILLFLIFCQDCCKHIFGLFHVILHTFAHKLCIQKYNTWQNWNSQCHTVPEIALYRIQTSHYKSNADQRIKHSSSISKLMDLMRNKNKFKLGQIHINRDRVNKKTKSTEGKREIETKDKEGGNRIIQEMEEC